MRIALVSQQYPPETADGGIGTQTYLKAHGLAALGHDVTVISWNPSGFRDERRDGDVRLIRIPDFDERLYVRSDIAYWLTYSAQVAAEISALDSECALDVVDFPDWGCEGYIHLLNESQTRGRLRSFIQLHGPLAMLAQTIGWPEPESDLCRIGMHIERTCLRLADVVYSSGSCSAAWCAEHNSLGQERVEIIHAGVDTTLFRPLAVQKDPRPTIVFVGRVKPNKGIETLVEAACLLAREHTELRLRIIGREDPGLAGELRAKACAAGHPALLEFRGYVRREQLPGELSRGHIFAAPSLYEGGPGFVYLEAMACGLPVVACSGSGADDVIRHGHNGLLVAPRHVEALAAALARLLADDAERGAMGQRARTLVVQEADTAVQIPRLARLYESTLAAST
jgi:glycosyltransferase involved in cell wall biosynthesis